MAIKRYKRFFGLALICLVAVVTGVAVGKIFVDQNAPAAVVTGTAADYKDSESEIVALYNRAQGGEGVESFSAVELFEIAEYKLSKQNHYRLMTGDVDTNTFGIVVNQYQQTERLFRDGVSVVNKLSPSDGGVAPDVCAQTIYNSNTGKIKINLKGSFVNKDKKRIETLKATFKEEDFKYYTNQEYVEAFSCEPSELLPYVVSSLTCGQGTYDKTAKKNADGTYSFEIKISGDHLAAAGIYYSKEIDYSAGVANFVAWDSLVMNVTIDKNFNFLSISYLEKYLMKHKTTGAKPVVTNKFVDKFFYGEDVPTLEEVLNGSSY